MFCWLFSLAPWPPVSLIEGSKWMAIIYRFQMQKMNAKKARSSFFLEPVFFTRFHWYKMLDENGNCETSLGTRLQRWWVIEFKKQNCTSKANKNRFSDKCFTKPVSHKLEFDLALNTNLCHIEHHFPTYSRICSFKYPAQQAFCQ